MSCIVRMRNLPARRHNNAALSHSDYDNRDSRPAMTVGVAIGTALVRRWYCRRRSAGVIKFAGGSAWRFADDCRYSSRPGYGKIMQAGSIIFGASKYKL